MLSYSEFSKTSPNLNNKVIVKNPIQNLVTTSLSEGSCYLTLTYKPHIKFNEVECSKDVKNLLNKLNHKIYGNLFEKGFKKINCSPIFEYNQSQGIKVHLLFELPTDKSRFKGDIQKLVVDTWYGMKKSGIKKEQDIRNCYDIQRMMANLSKQSKTGDTIIKYDVNNFYWK